MLFFENCNFRYIILLIWCLKKGKTHPCDCGSWHWNWLLRVLYTETANRNRSCWASAETAMMTCTWLQWRRRWGDSTEKRKQASILDSTTKRCWHLKTVQLLVLEPPNLLTETDSWSLPSSCRKPVCPQLSDTKSGVCKIVWGAARQSAELPMWKLNSGKLIIRFILTLIEHESSATPLLLGLQDF